MAVYALGDVEPRIDPTAYVHPDAVLIGNVEVGPESSIWPHAVLRADDNLIRVGARSSVQDNAVLHCTSELPTIVGDDVTLGHLCHLEGCTIEDQGLVGVGSVVLHEAVVGFGSIVGANAMVRNGQVVTARSCRPTRWRSASRPPCGRGSCPREPTSSTRRSTWSARGSSARACAAWTDRPSAGVR